MNLRIKPVSCMKVPFLFIRGVSIAVATIIAFAGITVNGQTPATLVSLGSSTPTPGSNDISQLSVAGQTNKPDGLNYYTDNQASYNGGEPGQTFVTRTNGTGYVLNSLAIKTGGGSSSGTGSGQSYLLHIYSVSNSTATVIATYLATNFSFADGDWLRWGGLGVPLSTNAVYAYSFGKASSAGPGWEAMGNAGGNRYTGGELGLMPVAGGTITFGGSHNYDAVFDAGLVPAVASRAVITNSPATAVQTTSATLNGIVISSGGSIPQITIYYGTADGETNAGAWPFSTALGPQTGNFRWRRLGWLRTRHIFSPRRHRIQPGFRGPCHRRNSLHWSRLAQFRRC